ncbi:DUF6320 domain-containing protein [Ruminococcaceae bacterium OttesenSCG-928-L11]|nr:DUF6320 domain-containing protein [Ruminococcaceae bacterium OttesenSCG-928-L11]
MKRCEQCGVKVDNPIEYCPLCHAMLVREDTKPEAPSYPNSAAQAEKYNIIFRILLFLSITVGSVCLTINLLTYRTHDTILWSILVIAGILYMWAAIGTAIRRHAKLGYNIMVQVVSLSAMLWITDYFAGDNGWAVNYVIPALFVIAMLSITIIIIVKRVDLNSFILYFLLIALLGFIPIILWTVGISTVRWPAVVSALYSAISLVSIFIFADNATKMELKKRFHI